MTSTFLDYFSELEDPRIEGMVTHPLEELLFSTLCAVLCGANDWVLVSEYSKENLSYLRRFLPFKNESASHDTYCKVFSILDGKKFEVCFLNWINSLLSRVEGIVAIDGKTCRGSRDDSNGKRAIHMISAFSVSQGLVIGQKKTDDKSNEITMIPELLEMLLLSGTIVTIDAMGCQRDICQKIIDKEADYVIGLKGNQGTLRSDVELYFNEQYQCGFKDSKVEVVETIEKDHGRIEERKYYSISDIDWLQESHKWPGLSAITMVKTKRDIKDRIEEEARFYIASCNNENKIPNAIRGHWGVENTLHWSLDVTFGDDLSRARINNLAHNFSIIKHIAFNILKKNPIKKSLNVKRHKASWNKKFLTELLTQSGKKLIA